MKILYITTALDETAYAKLLQKGKRLNNPSNQNFHSRLINLLRGFADVSVIRILATQNDVSGIEPQEKELYLPYESSRLKKMFSLPKEAMEFSPSTEVILFDSLSYRAIKLAKKLKDKRKIPAIAIVTDNPENLSETSYILQKAFLSALKNSDAAIEVNPRILDNLHYSKRTYTSIGFLDEEKSYPRLHEKPYFYYGGTLSERFGAPAMIKAFASADCLFDLLVAGHHGASLTTDDPRIKLLGQVSKEDNLAYEAHASLLINPRPYDETLDQESVPSKMIEYLSSGSPILSTPSTILKEEFGDDVNWIKGKDVYQEIRNFLLAHIKADKLIDIKENRAKQRLYGKYGNKAQEAALKSFIEETISSSNKSMTLRDS